MEKPSKFSQFWAYRVKPFLHNFGLHSWVIEVELPKNYGEDVKYADKAHCQYCSKEVALKEKEQ